MAARATRSASREARATEAVATGPLGALSHDELGVIFDGLADPLQPVVAVALSSTCLGLRTPLQAALEVLKERHARAVALCRKVDRCYSPCRPEHLRAGEQNADLHWSSLNIVGDDMATLGMILRTGGLPRLQGVFFARNKIGDAGLHSLCEGLATGAAPSLHSLDLHDNNCGPSGAEALAAALRSGAMPKLGGLWLSGNPIGNQGIATLTSALRKLPALEMLRLDNCEIDDEGVASLVTGLGTDDFKALKITSFTNKELTTKSCLALISVINEGLLPRLQELKVLSDPTSAEERAMQDALRARKAKRVQDVLRLLE